MSVYFHANACIIFALKEIRQGRSGPIRILPFPKVHNEDSEKSPNIDKDRPLINPCISLILYEGAYSLRSKQAYKMAVSVAPDSDRAAPNNFAYSRGKSARMRPMRRLIYRKTAIYKPSSEKCLTYCDKKRKLEKLRQPNRI
ncbi:unnamed protein product [Cylicocyclus nassatus]|uniref:Uncharacterized protein n=1 Tax=Cylicocyclus nassatus TaxID=53992 RepID=A0AA36M3D7_CYLNA|nr:unnamed protein product [Cylicocyclus nassatus]